MYSFTLSCEGQKIMMYVLLYVGQRGSKMAIFVKIFYSYSSLALLFQEVWIFYQHVTGLYSQCYSLLYQKVMNVVCLCNNVCKTSLAYSVLQEKGIFI